MTGDAASSASPQPRIFNGLDEDLAIEDYVQMRLSSHIDL